VVGLEVSNQRIKAFSWNKYLVGRVEHGDASQDRTQ